MSLLSANQIHFLMRSGVIENGSYENINAASLDITLGSDILVEKQNYKLVDMLEKNADNFERMSMSSAGYIIQPGQFILAHSKEIFNLPNNISAEYKLKSTQARNGLNHLLAGWCDAGWNGSVLTMEFKNVNQHTAIRIKPGMKCGQMVFFGHEAVPSDKSYANKGQYNGDLSVNAGKGLK